MQLPLVSVMVPTCNRPAFVARAAAARAADVAKLEVLVVDDSPAGRRRGRAARRLPARRARRRPPAATASARRQAAVRAAKGEVMVHWDDDDLYAPERIKQRRPSSAGQT